MNILFIGAGRMAEAIISGLTKQNNVTIVVTNKSDDSKLLRLKEKYRVHTSNDWKQHVTESDVILLASPPSTQEKILTELSSIISKQLVITIAAGIDPTFMEEKLPEGTPVCWIMPNTAAQIGQSISTFTCGQYVNEKHREAIKMILTSIGDYEELSEEQVHDLTAITGSAPAFLYAFAEALESSAQQYGMAKDQARKLVTKMIAGSAAMLEAGYSPQELREQVTTPGGSTAAGLDVLYGANFEELIQQAVIATNKHARSKTN
ncbi:MAG: pyrroline-5-carboxylate reductase [Bacillaceae bacterium]|nr:pyrroline-5-carboxylate reductase [Bacillaceae bacterium]